MPITDPNTGIVYQTYTAYANRPQGQLIAPMPVSAPTPTQISTPIPQATSVPQLSSTIAPPIPSLLSEKPASGILVVPGNIAPQPGSPAYALQVAQAERTLSQQGLA
jgi:hypothetical protein